MATLVSRSRGADSSGLRDDSPSEVAFRAAGTGLLRASSKAETRPASGWGASVAQPLSALAKATASAPRRNVRFMVISGFNDVRRRESAARETSGKRYPAGCSPLRRYVRGVVETRGDASRRDARASASAPAPRPTSVVVRGVRRPQYPDWRGRTRRHSVRRRSRPGRHGGHDRPHPRPACCRSALPGPEPSRQPPHLWRLPPSAPPWPRQPRR